MPSHRCPTQNKLFWDLFILILFDFFVSMLFFGLPTRGISLKYYSSYLYFFIKFECVCLQEFLMLFHCLYIFFSICFGLFRIVRHYFIIFFLYLYFLWIHFVLSLKRGVYYIGGKV